MKYCIGCEHFYIDLGSLAYSEYTPGSPGSISCSKNHFDIDGYVAEDKIYKVMSTANTCKDFSERPSPTKGE